MTAGRWLSPAPEVALTGVSTDSRAIARGQVFLALSGEKFDGHDFLEQVAKAGAAVLVVSDEAKARKFLDAPHAHAGLLLVPDTLTALQQLASAYRDALRDAGCKVIAVAGSNGKTTTRHLIHTVLSAKLKGTQSPKSFNNHIGVPLTILGAGLGSGVWGLGEEKKAPTHGSESAPQPPDSRPQTPDHFVVVEVGTNHPGEIEALARIVRPDIAVITSIGHEHMEFFKTLDGVAEEESAILPHIAAGGLAVINGDEPLLEKHIGRVPRGVSVVRFGEGAGNDLRLGGCEARGGAQEIALEPSPSGRGQGEGSSARNSQSKSPHPSPLPKGEGARFTLPLLGRHNAHNALAGITIARHLGLSDAEIDAALRGMTPVSMRLNVERLGSDAAPLLLINDAYNANPSSVRAALETLRQQAPPLPSGRRVAILGDMFELGELGPDLHRSIGAALGELGGDIRFAVLIGRLSLFTAEALGRVWSHDRFQAFPEWDASVPEKVAALLRPGDVLLIKASRGMGLERVVPAIEARFGGRA